MSKLSVQAPTLRRRVLTSWAAKAAAGTIAVSAMAAPIAIAPAASALTANDIACGAVLVPGSAWLGGAGVDAKHNKRVPGNSSSCGGVSVADPTVQAGGGWQCIELANRLYLTKGWGTVFAGNNGGAQFIPEGSLVHNKDLQFFANGSGYTPVAGDLVVEWGNSDAVWGHVTVVDHVTATTIEAVEQNAALTGRKTYPFKTGIAAGAYSTRGVRGFMHSPLNGGAYTALATSPVTNFEGTITLTGDTAGSVLLTDPAAAGAPATVVVKKAKAGKKRITVKWTPPAAATPITSYQIWVRKVNKKTNAYTAINTFTVSAGSYKKVIMGLKAKKTYRINVRALNTAGIGNWSEGKNVVPTA